MGQNVRGRLPPFICRGRHSRTSRYQDLPNRLLKVRIKDRAIVSTTDAERRCTAPAGLQEAVDAEVAKFPGSRSFVRPCAGARHPDGRAASGSPAGAARAPRTSSGCTPRCPRHPPGPRPVASCRPSAAPGHHPRRLRCARRCRSRRRWPHRWRCGINRWMRCGISSPPSPGKCGLLTFLRCGSHSHIVLGVDRTDRLSRVHTRRSAEGGAPYVAYGVYSVRTPYDTRTDTRTKHRTNTVRHRKHRTTP